jgi:AmmeMemoRadiSam system protein B
MKKKERQLALLSLIAFICFAFYIKKTEKANKELLPDEGEVLSAEEFVEENEHFACPFSENDYLTEGAEAIEKYSADAVIVPHHLLAKDLINRALQMIKNKDEYQTVVIIGPNHRNWGRSNIQSSLASWKTKFGEIKPNTNLILAMENHNLALIEEENFDTEHAVCSLVSFVEHYFSKANIIPLILKSSTTNEEAKKLAHFLGENCVDCLLIISTDFSHDATVFQAELNDQASVGLLENISEANAEDVICDSIPSLITMQHYLKEKGVKKGTLIESSDSSKISGNYIELVTSYVTMAY